MQALIDRTMMIFALLAALAVLTLAWLHSPSTTPVSVVRDRTVAAVAQSAESVCPSTLRDIDALEQAHELVQVEARALAYKCRTEFGYR
jgi:hypothetical protein